MPEFVFMLTHDDATVEDAFEVYDEVRDTGLLYRFQGHRAPLTG